MRLSQLKVVYSFHGRVSYLFLCDYCLLFVSQYGSCISYNCISSLSYFFLCFYVLSVCLPSLLIPSPLWRVFLPCFATNLINFIRKLVNCDIQREDAVLQNILESLDQQEAIESTPVENERDTDCDNHENSLHPESASDTCLNSSKERDVQGSLESCQMCGNTCESSCSFSDSNKVLYFH